MTNKRSGGAKSVSGEAREQSNANLGNSPRFDSEQLTMPATEIPAVPVPEQEFFIPVHGQVRLTLAEVRVVNHPAFQRLGDVYQLGQVHFVFRGATHRRFEHALGTLYVAQMMMEHIDQNRRTSQASVGARWRFDSALTPVERSMIRLAALLHDLGHIPAGHTLEDELSLLPQHDELHRLELVLDRPRWHSRDTEPLRQLIDSSYAAELNAAGIDATPSTVFLAIVAKDPPHLPPSASLRVPVCRDLVGNTICADLIDYLHRDWHHLGKPRFFDKRLIEYMELRHGANDGEEPRSQIVVNLRNSEQIRSDAVTGILDLLESRYQLGEVALYHRTKLCAAAMLERAVAEIAEAQGDARSQWLEDLVGALLELSDEQMLAHLAHLADEAALAGSSRSAPYLRAASDISRSLRVRHLYKQVYVSPAYHLAKHAATVQRMYGQSGPANRLVALRRLERDFELPPGSLAMYCPPSDMNPKIAHVQILVDDHVATLDDHEKMEQDAGLTGGHLRAQQRRFERLWRILIAASPEALAQINKGRLFPVLIRAIESLVLGRRPNGVSMEEQSESIAQELGALLGRKVVPSGIAARGGQFEEPYPTGAPALVNFFSRKAEPDTG